MVATELLQEYQSLRDGDGFVWHEDRAILKFTGPDSSKFLHNFCTANVNAMQPGDVCEAFVLDSRGKTLSFGHILKYESDIFWTAACKAHSAALREHFDKYIIREDVIVDDLSDLWIAAIEAISPSKSDWESMKDHCSDENSTRTAVAEFAGRSRLYLSQTDKREILVKKLSETPELSADALSMIRMENGTPWYGIEIDESNLPQEIRRDDKAISFTKGCYLGQETVAKIDAIGHVNRFMVGLKIDNADVQQAAEIRAGDKNIGELRNITWSPALNAVLGIGFVKRQFAEPGTAVLVDNQSAEIVALPV